MTGRPISEYEDVASYKTLQELCKGLVWQDNFIYPIGYGDLDLPDDAHKIKTFTFEEWLESIEALCESWQKLIDFFKTLKSVYAYHIPFGDKDDYKLVILGYDKYNNRIGIIGAGSYSWKTI